MHPFLPHSWRGLVATLLLATGVPGWAQADPPSRIAYISALDGAAQVSQAADPEQWMPAAPNWPITTGTRLRVDPGTRAELDGGWMALRLQGAADLDTTVLDDNTTQVALTAGSLSLRMRELDAGERVEIDTPQLAVIAQQPGEYRVDVDPAGTTRVTVRAGAALLYGDAAQSMPLAQGSQVLVSGRSLGLLAQGAAPGRDAFEQWVALRDAQQDGSVSASYLPRDMPGYQELDAHGQWAEDSTWGPVWYPNLAVADWAPYRYGRWTWVDPWGWTWVDDAPWGFAPFHYGRWTQIGPRWAWVPGSVPRRPVYAPALVQFVAGGSGWSLSIGGAPGAAWFPLAPGEAWQPHYHASARYLGRINDRSRWRGPPPRPARDGYFFQHRPGAISLAPQGGFGRAPASGVRPRYRDGNQLPAGWLRDSRVGTPPARVGALRIEGTNRAQPRTGARPDWRQSGPGARDPDIAPPRRSEVPRTRLRPADAGTPPATPDRQPAVNPGQPGWRAPAGERQQRSWPERGAPSYEHPRERPRGQVPERPAAAESPVPPQPRLERMRPAAEAGASRMPERARAAPPQALRKEPPQARPPRIEREAASRPSRERVAPPEQRRERANPSGPRRERLGAPS